MDKDKEFNAIEYRNQYNKKKYDRIGIMVPKGRKEEIKKRAEMLKKSINEYINCLISKDLES